MQPHRITLAFHREMADSSRQLVGPDITAAATLERYPRFIKGCFQDYERLGVKVARNNVFWSPPTKESFLELTSPSGHHSKSP
jgi:hypothetical protein